MDKRVVDYCVIFHCFIHVYLFIVDYLRNKEWTLEGATKFCLTNGVNFISPQYNCNQIRMLNNKLATQHH